MVVNNRKIRHRERIKISRDRREILKKVAAVDDMTAQVGRDQINFLQIKKRGESE